MPQLVVNSILLTKINQSIILDTSSSRLNVQLRFAIYFILFYTIFLFCLDSFFSNPRPFLSPIFLRSPCHLLSNKNRGHKNEEKVLYKDELHVDKIVHEQCGSEESGVERGRGGGLGAGGRRRDSRKGFQTHRTSTRRG